MPGLLQIAGVFVRYANLTLGGGNAITAVIHREIVDKRHWVGNDRFGLAFALARLTPGTNLLAFCTAIGWQLQRLPGALVALAAASVPCTIIIVLATMIFDRLQQSTAAQAAIHGAIAAAVGITVTTCWTIVEPNFKGNARIRVVLIGAAAFALHAFLAFPAIDVVLLAAVVGFFLPPAEEKP